MSALAPGECWSFVLQKPETNPLDTGKQMIGFFENGTVFVTYIDGKWRLWEEDGYGMPVVNMISWMRIPQK